MLPNPGMESYCQYKLQGLNNTEAWKAAGFTCKTPTRAHTACHKLAHNPIILNRIKELQEQANVKHELTRDYLLKKMIGIVSDGSNSESVRAAERICKMMGWDKDTLQVNVKNSTKEMSDAELLKYLEGNNGQSTSSTGTIVTKTSSN